ncbi:MAG: MFS transporter [Hyphomicrobium sp.]|nr:MFS transporter [Hyphomicrobium sp.]
MTTRSSAAQSETGSADRATLLSAVLIATMAFLTVVDLFAAQALLPSLSAHYSVPPAAMSLAVNACTFGMAAAGLALALLGGRIGHRFGIAASLSLLALPTVLLAFAPNLQVFAALRVAQGILMATAFSLTLGYLGERYMARAAATAFAAYITGNVASNLIGRLISAAVVDHAGLAAAFYVFAGLNLFGAALALLFVERIAAETPRQEGSGIKAAAAAVRQHLADPRLRAGFGIGFCVLFAFIGTFTFINFVLTKPPLSVGMMQLGFIYFVFLPSILTTPLAGELVERTGPRTALWTALAGAALGLPMLLAPNLSLVLTGMTLVAVGTFAAQAVATGYVARTARSARSAASGLYLASYYLGGLAGTAFLGPIFDGFGWPACVVGIGLALAAAAVLSVQLVDQR